MVVHGVRAGTWRVALVLAAVLGACSNDAPPTNVPCAGAGCVPGQPTEPQWDIPGVFGVPNLDDDDANDVADFFQPWWAGDDDASLVVLAASDLALVGEGETLTLMLEGEAAAIKIYFGDTQILGANVAATSYDLALPAAAERSDVELRISFGNYAGAGTLKLSHRAADGKQLPGKEISLQAAPLITNHHLQDAEHVWALRQGSGNNAAFIDAFEDALGSKFTAIPSSGYGGDVWVQDEFEFATLTGEAGQRVDVVIDSIRNRGIDAYKHVLVGDGRDALRQTWGVVADRSSYDSFGNLEASPPVTVGGVAYPFGRIYYGRENGVGISGVLAEFLTSQKVQAPFELPTRWLCVGHVDEFSSFVPDASSPKGFKLVLADVRSAWTLLQGLPSNYALPLYDNDHGYGTVGELLGDNDLVALNNDLQQDQLDVIRNRFKTELGLDDSDIVLVPSLFETVGGCGGRVAALIPGMVNLTVARVGSTTHLFTADPFFRSAGGQVADPVIQSFKAAMPAGLTMHFVDDWDTYHMGLGEVHCGSNVRRAPATSGWWTNTQALLGW
ncbi:MAG: hypothetical protein IPL79_02105 [Myxococcales bacterium]|nr:hypothetical protein [Myxococcales bacterium]